MIAAIALAACSVMFLGVFLIDKRKMNREFAWHRHCNEAVAQTRYEYLEHVEASS